MTGRSVSAETGPAGSVAVTRRGAGPGAEAGARGGVAGTVRFPVLRAFRRREFRGSGPN
ncbi:hypothetical protein GCM10009759_32750 [Kitasatospora saccharophila]|uniref:Uncharacterized protein n=1 Tax=Kitasatospora saccharophila TaxID=407973 RepID=A0ABN2WW27_9ACTN